MKKPPHKVLEMLSDQIPEVEKVIEINPETGYPICPLCKNDLGLSNETYVICKNPNCAFFKNFWDLFKFLKELISNQK